MKRYALEVNLADAKKRVSEIEMAIVAFDTAPENNMFDTIDHASRVLEDRLRNEAFEDCEGAGNCGNDKYTQEFIVNGIRYIATLTVEYGRHDKTYYFIDESEFSIAPVN